MVAKSYPTLVTPWTIVHQAPLSIGFSRQDTGVGCHFLLQLTEPFYIIEAAPLPKATSAQQAKLYALTWGCTLAESKFANISIDSRYGLEVVHSFWML